MIAAIAGRALRTPLGGSSQEVVSRMLKGEHAVRAVPQGALCQLECAIPARPSSSRNQRFLDRLGLFALDAGREALADAGLAPGDPRLERTALFAATGGLRPRWEDLVRGLARQRGDGQGLWENGLSGLHPFWMLQHLSNNAHAVLSIELRLRGDGATFAGATASAEALCAAVRALDAGAADSALVVACDSLLDPQSVADLAARRIATRASLAEWRPPYDVGAAGVVPGDGAAAVVLVRGAGADGLPRISAAARLDPAPLASGEPGPARLTEIAALVSRGEQVVDGASWGEPELDLAEREALAGLLPGSANLVSTASSLGRMGAAAPLVQAILAVEMLRRRALPPVAGLIRAAAGPLRPTTVATASNATSALLLSTGAPGLACAIRVEVA